MIDGLTVPLTGTLETDPDAIPRGFIHRDPDILNIHQQNTLSEMKVKMMDFNSEYLAKHPQVEGLVRLLIKEIVIHKPYYVRDFIKEILSRDDLESKVAQIVAAKRINTNRRHTRHYFSHTKTWQDKAAGVNEPDLVTDEPIWPEPRPFRVETRRDKREYCHPHYFKVPYVFFPAEYLKPKEPVFKTRTYPKFRSRSYAKLVLENYKDVWGDPITNLPPPLNTEELYTACPLLKRKQENEMTNEELIKCCLRCRRTRMRSYLYALNKKQFNDPLKKYPSYTIFQNSIKHRVANKFLEKTLEAMKRNDVKTINCAWVPENGPINYVDRELIKFESRFIEHRPLADMNEFKSPVPGLRFRENGDYRLLLPLSDLTRDVDGKSEINPRVTMLRSDQNEKSVKLTGECATTWHNNWKLPTTDLHGNLIEHSEISITLKSRDGSQIENDDSYIRLGERKIGSSTGVAIDEKHILMEETRMRRTTTMVSQEEEKQPSITPKKRVLIRDSVEREIDSVRSSTMSYIKEDSLIAIAGASSGEKIETYSRRSKGKVAPPLPSYMVDPYMQLLVDSKKLNNYFKRERDVKRKCNVRRKLEIHHLENYM